MQHRTTRSRLRWYIAAGATLATITVVTFVAINYPRLIDQLLGLEDPPHLSDGELIDNFYRHRAEIEQLRQMIKQDKGLARVSADGRTLPENAQTVGVGPARLDEYRSLLKKARVSGGIAVSDDQKVVELTITHRGFATHRSEKGYLYIDGPVNRELLPDLDRFSAKEVGSGLRAIDGGWYLYFEGH